MNLTHKKLRMSAWMAAIVLSVPLVAQAHRTHPPQPEATLSAEAAMEVEQDTVRVTLAAELAGPTQASVADQLNQRLDAVMQAVKGHADVQASTGTYRLWPSTDRDGRISEWRGRGEIILKSQDFAQASRLAAAQADKMPIDGIYFSVSEARQNAVEEQLLGQAVQAFQARAKALAEALGYAGYRLRSVDLSGAGRLPQPVGAAPRMMSVMADSAAAPIEGGRERISVSVSGSVFLLTKQTESPQ